MSPLDRRQLLQSLVAGGLGLTALGRGFAGVAGAVPLLAPDTRPDPAKPEGTDLLPQIEHVIVLLMENHSYDSYFGTLGRGDGFTLGPDGKPTNANPDAGGVPVVAYRAGTTDQTGISVHQNWNSSHRQFGGGALDQFVVESGPDAMAYWTAAEIPFYHDLANTFPVCDRFFCSVPGPTYPNRRFLTAATAHGNTRTDLNDIATSTPPVNGVIFERFDQFGISWTNYNGGLPEIALWPYYFTAHADRAATIEAFHRDAASGSLPFFSLVTPPLDIDEHPPKDIAFGEQFAAGIIASAMNGPGWERTLLVYTYDEHGGFYDHVAPPAAVPPDAVGPSVYDPAVPGADAYDRYGFRVPAVIVSPYARAGYVSSIVHDFTSILRFVETKWNLGALTARDANASNLLDALDLGAPPAFAEPPSLDAPLLGYPDTAPAEPPAGPADPVAVTPRFTG